MLGLCWTPIAIQSMQKMASTMPSNPEQLLGAILVRKDIFHRFETTMHDTCLDANNLLEYLFSLYNSTAAPAERDNLPPSQDFQVNRRDKHRKVTGRGQHAFSHQPNMVNSQSIVQGRLLDSPRGHQSGAANGRRKKIKIEQSGCLGDINFAAQHQDSNESVSLKPFDSLQGFPCSSNSPTSCIKMEAAPEAESQQTQSSSPIPPFSQLHYQVGKPYSPKTSHFSDVPTTPSQEDRCQNLGLIAGGDASDNVNLEIEDLQGMLKNQEVPKEVQGKSKRTKKIRLKGSRRQSIDGNNGSYGEYTGRRRKAHQCFCGALFTRADNLKRHIRKCHEEKLEKLNAVPLEFDIDNNNIPDFSQPFSSSDQEVIESSSQLQDSQDHQQLQDHKKSKDNNVIKSAADVKWSCFCGESFSDHRQLVEHTKSHENSI